MDKETEKRLEALEMKAREPDGNFVGPEGGLYLHQRRTLEDIAQKSAEDARIEIENFKGRKGLKE